MSINAKIFEDAPGTGGYSGPVTSDQLHAALGASGLDSGTQGSVYKTLIPDRPAASSSSSGNSQPGYNYSDLINQDALYGQQKADLSAESASDAANRAAAIQRALIQWGIVPDFAASAQQMGLSADSLGFLQSDVTPGTKELADKNTAEGLSMSARLAKAHKDQIRAIKNALAARGMAQSGEMGSQLGEEAQNYKQQMTDAEQQMLAYITGAIQAFTNNERSRQRTLAQYMMDAAQHQAGLLGDAGSGSGGSGSGGGGGGVTSDFIYDATMQGGLNPGDYWNSAVAGAPAGAKPMHIMNQGQIQNGTVSIKYMMPNGQTNTIPVRVVRAGGGSSSSGGGSSSPAPSGGGLFGSDFGG